MKMSGRAAYACALFFASTAHAQWAIGAAGERRADPPRDRFVYMVFADPVPGQEATFNDWYLNVHMGDLLQLQGWDGAQRFRLATDASPRRAPDGGYRNGYAILWDLSGTDLAAVGGQVGPAIVGGKSRKSPAFDYSRGAGTSVTYRVEAPRVTRPDKRRAFMPAPADNVTPRPNRYMMIEMVDPAPGVDPKVFVAAVDRYVGEVLTLPGWMAAQRFSFAPVPATAGGPPATRYPATMLLWETEGASAVDLSARRDAALAQGSVTRLPIDPATMRTAWWQPISPYATKNDIQR